MAQSEYTLGALKQQVYGRLDNNTIFWDSTEVNSIINEAMRVTNLICGWYQGTLQQTSVAGKLVYTTPTGMIFPQRCQFNGTQLDPIPITRIGQDYRTWATDNSNKDGPVSRWIPIGINYFCLHPVDSIGGNDIYLTGVIETPVLVNDSDVIVMEDQYSTMVVEYCAERLPLKLGGSNFAQASQGYSRIFLPAMKAMTNNKKTSFPRYFVLTGKPTTEDNTT